MGVPAGIERAFSNSALSWEGRHPTSRRAAAQISGGVIAAMVTTRMASILAQDQPVAVHVDAA
jgi:hypothetical protein